MTMFYLLVQGIASKRYLLTVYTEVIRDLNLLKKDDLLPFFLAHVHRIIGPTGLTWCILLKNVGESNHNYFDGGFVCAMLAPMNCLPALSRGMQSWSGACKTRTWTMQQSSSGWDDALIEVRTDKDNKWANNKRGKPDEAMERAWWGREGQGADRAISFDISLSSYT